MPLLRCELRLCGLEVFRRDPDPRFVPNVFVSSPKRLSPFHWHYNETADTNRWFKYQTHRIKSPYRFRCFEAILKRSKHEVAQKKEKERKRIKKEKKEGKNQNETSLLPRGLLPLSKDVKSRGCQCKGLEVCR
jgi:hypothetical protein